MTPAELHAFFAEHFPSARGLGFEIVALGPDGAELALDTRDDHLRPGGTVSGPVLMTLADTAMYVSLLAKLGPSVAQGVTSSLETHFLRRADPGRLTVRCRLLKLGRRLAVGTVDLANADGALVAFAIVTYALPG
jgi:uncharacterized protein (TIGR00369 family)